MTDVATLSDGEIIALRDVLAAARNPQQLAEIEARAREIEERETRAAYEREIAASMERAARDPIAQELFRNAREQAKADRDAEIAQLRRDARLDIEGEIAAKRKVGLMSDLNPCRDCGLKPFSMKQVGFSNVSFCQRCHALHRLRCDICGDKSDKAIPTSWCPADQQFRCPRCLEEFASQPLPKPFLVPGR